MDILASSTFGKLQEGCTAGILQLQAHGYEYLFDALVNTHPIKIVCRLLVKQVWNGLMHASAPYLPSQWQKSSIVALSIRFSLYIFLFPLAFLFFLSWYYLCSFFFIMSSFLMPFHKIMEILQLPISHINRAFV